MTTLDLRKVGLFLRDREQAYPLSELRGFFAARGIDLVLLDGEG